MRLFSTVLLSVLLTWQNSGLGGLMNSAEFVLPLQDLGNGAVDLSLGRGVGPATFTRATAAAAKLSTGLWKLDVASGTARSSYIGLNTAAGAYGGYCPEGAATQLAVDVRDMTQVSWVKVTMTTAQTSTGIDGVANSCTRLTAAGANSTILQTLVAAATSRTYSAWVRRVTGTGTIILKQGTATLDITALINSSTYTLVQLNDNELNVAYGIQINTSGDAIDVDCNQFEAGAIASTPIPAAGTRNADVLTYPSAGNYSANAGSMYAEFSSYTTNTGTTQGILSADAGDANRNQLRLSTAGVAQTVQVGVAVSTGTPSAGAQSKIAGSWSGTDVGGLKVALNGAAPATGNAAGVAAGVTTIRVGLNEVSAAQLFGTIKNVRIWARQLPNATLQAITA